MSLVPVRRRAAFIEGGESRATKFARERHPVTDAAGGGRGAWSLQTVRPGASFHGYSRDAAGGARRRHP
jgi:hypothetical protein